MVSYKHTKFQPICARHTVFFIIFAVCVFFSVKKLLLNELSKSILLVSCCCAAGHLCKRGRQPRSKTLGTRSRGRINDCSELLSAITEVVFTPCLEKPPSCLSFHVIKSSSHNASLRVSRCSNNS